MNPAAYEKQLLDALKCLYINLQRDSLYGADFVESTCKRVTTILSTGDLHAKFACVKSFFNFYGGMGSLQDQLSGNPFIASELSALYGKTFKLKQIYWCLLGNEFYPDGSFEVFPIGTRVRILQHAVFLINEEGQELRFASNDTSIGGAWKVSSNYHTDISNMPEYVVTDGNGTYRTIRHIALERVLD